MTDYTYRRYHSSHRKGELWGVYSGRTTLETICRSEEEAKIAAENLNRDPWHYDRIHWEDFKKARGMK